MKTFKMYVKPGYGVNLGKMRSRLKKRHDMTGSTISKNGEDILGIYHVFHVPDTVDPGEIERYHGVNAVYDVTPSEKLSVFKAYVKNGDVMDFFREMWDNHGMEIKHSGEEKKWFLGKKSHYILLEGNERVIPAELEAAYPALQNIEKIDQYLVDALRTVGYHKKIVPEMV
jgi:hypothetical protein